MLSTQPHLRVCATQVSKESPTALKSSILLRTKIRPHMHHSRRNLIIPLPAPPLTLLRKGHQINGTEIRDDWEASMRLVLVLDFFFSS